MLKLLFYAAVLVIGCKLLFGRWPWEYLRTAPTRQQALGKARQLLGVSAQASRAEIIDAHRRMIAIVHPDRGGTNSQVHEANAARDMLFDELPTES